MFVESLPLYPLWLVANADGLQWNGRQDAPAWSIADLTGEPLGVLHVAPQAILQSGHALLTDHEPQLQRAKAAPQRKSPIAEVLHLRVVSGLQKAGVGRHDPD